MAKLILSLEGSVIREAPLDKEKITIGRKASNDIQIENLAVSGEHAQIVTILNDSFLEDLGSTNGTLVNGATIKKHILQDKDIIEIGKYKLEFVAEAAAGGPQASVDDFERTMVLRAPAAPPSPSAASMAAPVTPTAGTGTAMIQILSGPGAGKEMPLVKNLTTLGKPGVQVAVITKRPQGYFITHVDGAKFPMVNGTALSTQAHGLSDHDVIEIAGVKMEFSLKA